MGLPGHRRTSSHKRRRAAHFALKKMTLVACAKCKTPNLPHRACVNCGAYAGRQVVAMKTRLDAKKRDEAHDHDHDHQGHDHA